MERTCHCTEGCSAAKAASRGASHSEATEPLAEIASIGRDAAGTLAHRLAGRAELREGRLDGRQQRRALRASPRCAVAGAVARAGQQRRAECRLQTADLVADGDWC